MVEVVGLVALHSELFHDAARSYVGDGCKRYDLAQIQFLESENQCCTRAFGGDAAAPVFGGESPADFDAGREVGVIGWNVEANGADEGSFADEFYGPHAEPMLVEEILNAAELGV